MSSSFEKTYPLVIWALKLHMADELFDLPQANLTSVPLHKAFSWAYAHFTTTTIYLHVVCEYRDPVYVELVTAYIPDETRWYPPDFVRRRRER
jgi:hypothetical protein